MGQPNEYNLGSLQWAEKVMDQTSGLVRQDLAQLTKILVHLEPNWRGNAAAKMDQTMQQWNDAQGKLLNALDRIRELVGRSRVTFDINEQEQAALMDVPVVDYASKLK